MNEILKTAKNSGGKIITVEDHYLNGGIGQIVASSLINSGINIKMLHNVIFASPSKSRIRNLQSIGRVLRKGKNKTKAVLYDIADDLRHKKHTNHTLNHFMERVDIYNEEKFPFKIYNIGLKNG